MRLCEFFVPVEHLLRPFFLLGIREVQERVSERIEKVPGRYVDGTLNISRVAEIGKQRAIGNSVVVCVCVCVCVCSCVRACVCLRACDVLCVCINVWHLLVQTKREARSLVCFLI